MSTRGAYGFYRGGKEKVTYNHFDSYPTGLGKDVIVFIGDTSNEELNDISDKIKLVNGNKEATLKQIEECKEFSDTHVSTGKLTEWYCLLRNAQGELGAFKKGLKYMVDGKSFLNDSLYCEWAYIINLDTSVLEIYKGFNKNKNAKGRYARNWDKTNEKEKENSDVYYGVELLKEIPLDEIREIAKDEDKLHDFLTNVEESGVTNGGRKPTCFSCGMNAAYS